MRGRNLVLPGMAALFAAMLGRAGFVDWLFVLKSAAIVSGGVLFALACTVAVIACIAVVLSPVGFLVWGLVKLFGRMDVPGAAGPRPPKAGVGPAPTSSRAAPGNGFTMG